MESEESTGDIDRDEQEQERAQRIISILSGQNQ